MIKYHVIVEEPVQAAQRMFIHDATRRLVKDAIFTAEDGHSYQVLSEALVPAEQLDPRDDFSRGTLMVRELSA
jgi:hypothetical protein